MGKYLLFIGLGGFLGSISRYLTVVFSNKIWSSTFPIGTFMANILGCLLIGVIVGFSVGRGWFSTEWKLFLVTGFCGGYTTFSSYALENIELLQSGNYIGFLGYLFSSIIIGMIAVFLGILITKF